MASSSSNTMMDVLAQPATDAALELIRELYAIKGQRYQWAMGIRERMLDDWREHCQAFDVWFQKATDAIKKMKDEGNMALAERLSTVILARPMVHDPGNFALSIPTGWGEEAFQITGSSEVQGLKSRNVGKFPLTTSGDPDLGDDLEYEVLRTQPGYCPQVPTWDISQYLALAQPIDFELGDNFEFDLEPVSLRDAIAEKLWITPAPSGPAFCLTCNCPEMPHNMMPLATRAATGSYNLIARHYHTNPFSDNFALVHMLQAHLETFPATPEGMRAMIKKYGRRVEFPSGNTPPGEWIVAMNNFAGKTWYESLPPDWAALQRKYQPRDVQGADRGQRSQLRRLEDINRSIEANALLDTDHIFDWPEHGPDTESWVIICPHRDCYCPHFPHHPLRNARAINHFKVHDLYLKDNQEVLYLFGLKVLNMAPSPEPVEEITQPTKKRKSDRASGRPRLLNGKDSYRIWSYQALWDECVRRKIPLPKDCIHLKKAALEKRLRIHDGVDDYTSHKVWPFTALQEECVRRGLPIVSPHGVNKYKRGDLIRMLKSDNLKRRQQAASTPGSSDHGTPNKDVQLPDTADIPNEDVQLQDMADRPSASVQNVEVNPSDDE